MTGTIGLLPCFFFILTELSPPWSYPSPPGHVTPLPPQVRYAAGDAQVSVALFFHLLGLGGDSSPSPCSSISPSPSSPAYLSTGTAPYAQLAAQCQGLVDVPFREGRGSGRGAAEGDENTPFRGGGDGGGDRRPRRLAFESLEAGDQQVPDPRRNQKRKPLGVGYFAR